MEPETSHKIVKVTWKDIVSIDAGAGSWLTPKEVAEKGWEYYNTNYYTTGVIAYENLEFIVLAATWEDEDFADCSMIPRSVIVKIEELPCA